MSENKKVCFVDLDGTLARYEEWDDGKIGEAVPRMLARVNAWIKQGHEIVIFTARARDESEIVKVKAWLKENNLPDLEVTNIKSYKASVFYDDRGVSVIKNTGYTVEETADAVINNLKARVAELEAQLKPENSVKLYNGMGGEIK